MTNSCDDYILVSSERNVTDVHDSAYTVCIVGSQYCFLLLHDIAGGAAIPYVRKRQSRTGQSYHVPPLVFVMDRKHNGTKISHLTDIYSDSHKSAISRLWYGFVTDNAPDMRAEELPCYTRQGLPGASIKEIYAFRDESQNIIIIVLKRAGV